MTKDEVNLLISEAVRQIQQTHEAQLKRLEDRAGELEKAPSQTVQQLSKRITQLGG